MVESEQLLRQTYAAFNSRDIETALAAMHPDVDWPNGWEGGREQGRDAVREYWRRQFESIDSRADPVGFAEDEQGRIVVVVHQVVHDSEGKLLADQQVEHVYTLRDGLVERMDIREG
ncbi:MAG: nuclear transport factor 2 family protein [Solirubrobacterales bacterium]